MHMFLGEVGILQTQWKQQDVYKSKDSVTPVKQCERRAAVPQGSREHEG